MKRLTPYLSLCLLGVVIWHTSQNRPPRETSKLTIYDTAIYMLQDFVIDDSDWNLGFSSRQEVMKARIDTSGGGIDFYYMRKDSLLAGKLSVDTLLIKLHRRVYPVFVDSVLHAAITFDSTRNGWQPVMFDDSNIISACIADRRKQPNPHEGRHTYSIVLTPFIHLELVVEHDSTGNHVLVTAALRTEMGKDLPGGGAAADLTPISEEVFVDSLRHHMMKLE
ncbi:MAG: hypothetical protein Q8896_01155 [Bacteroidota bacterium]|nr:hypothetical protein [Bacteroidota bacterium]MDP4237832.1 hypothetical protein [Bacteroidota bacterium]